MAQARNWKQLSNSLNKANNHGLPVSEFQEDANR
jgi:hypothetical protein